MLLLWMLSLPGLKFNFAEGLDSVVNLKGVFQ
jgi:hypothetical protein